jgi:hypothetical protein
VSASPSDRSLQVGSGAALAAERRLIAPDPEIPRWRAGDGTRHSYGRFARRSGRGSRRSWPTCTGSRESSRSLGAHERGDHAETARVAAVAARLYGEIRGLWPPSAVEIPRRKRRGTAER